MQSSRRALTFPQFMFLVALLILGFAPFVSALARARQTAASKQCLQNLRQLGIAMHNFHDQLGVLPPMIGGVGEPPNHGTFFFHLLPYLELDNLYKGARETDAEGVTQANGWGNGTQGRRVEVFECPDDKSNAKGELFQGWLAPSSYAANALVFGTTVGVDEIVSLQGAARIPASFPDGTSNTICFAERYQICNGDVNAWGYYADSQWAPMFARYSKAKFQWMPRQADCDANVPQTMHEAGISVSMGDASARTVSPKVSSTTWWSACTPAGGEVLGADWN